MSCFSCPVCRSELFESESKYNCINNHCFDKAKSGYVNLLMSQKSSSKRHGDDKLMVSSRREFLDKGYYSGVSDALTEAVGSVLNASGVIIDAGCGDGYYTKALYESFGKSEIYGIDISKEALTAASKRGGAIKYAVASTFSLPFNSASADIITNVFAPCAYDEFYRVLKKDGCLVKVVPLSEHLWELKKAVYDNPRKNKPELLDERFTLIKATELKYSVRIDGADDIRSLFSMTPFFYKTSATDAAKLNELDSLDVTIHINAEIYKTGV